MSAKLAESPKHYMMVGTGGSMDYLMFARKGQIGLGVKLNVIADGKLPDTTYFGARLRSAKLPDDMQQEVINLMHVNLTIDKAWPLVDHWDAKDSKRCSAQLGMYLRGNLKKDPELLTKAVLTGKLGKPMAKFLVSMVDESDLVMTEDEIAAWIDEFYTPISQNIIKSNEVSKLYDKVIESSVGIFDLTAKLHKKVAEEQAKAGITPAFDDEHAADDVPDADGFQGDDPDSDPNDD